MPTPLRILFLASEADPFVKIGGLGDVAGSLPPALMRVDPQLDIRLVIPFHGAIQRRQLPLRQELAFAVTTPAGTIPSEALTTEHDGVTVHMIAGPPITPDAPVYTADAAEDAEKFVFFSVAALEMARAMDWQPDIVHANDWHTAVTPYLLDLTQGQDSFYQDTRSLLGLHNLPYMGNGAGPALDAYGIPPASASPLPGWAQHLPLPLGLLAADHIVTVSPNYAREILQPEFSSGLEEFLRTRADSISGILNGIDTRRWDPAGDPAIPANFNIDTLQHRPQNKAALQAEFDLPQDPQVPLLGLVSRMDSQKGIDLVPDALRQVAHLPWQAIILGTGVVELEAVMRQLQDEFPERLRAVLRFDAPLSHRIYAGSDALLIPSRYEPCGLTQMIAMRYGCVPVARATGGLVDTIRDGDDPARNTGFLFQNPESASLARAIERVISQFQDTAAWGALQRSGMRGDFSWERSAQGYLDLYQSLISDRRSI